MKCLVCKNTSQNKPYQIKEMMYGLKKSFTYFQCPKCGCLQITKPPKDLSKYYPKDYYSYNPKPLEKTLIQTIKSILIRKPFLLLLRIISPKLYSLINIIYKTGIKSNSAILDVGCGNGELLYSLRLAGYKNTKGIDPFISKNIDYQNGLSIKKESLDKVKGPWDLIMFNHSLEHMPNQLSILKKVSSLLAKNGKCLIRIPNADSFAWRKYRENWMQIDAPRHFYIQTPKSFKILAEQAKLHAKEIIYDSNELQFWASEQYSKGIPLNSNRSYLINPNNSLFKKKDIACFIKQAKKLNINKNGDQIAIILEKTLQSKKAKYLKASFFQNLLLIVLNEP